MREMIRRVSRWSVIAAPLFIVMVCGMAWGGVNPVKIGVLAKRGPELCMEKWAPTAEYLTARIPGKTFVIVPLDFDKICSFVEKGKVDFILANPAFYVELESRYGADRIATLKNLRLGAGYTQFGGVVFSRADRTDLTGLRDLKNIAFIAADPRAFGAWIAVLRELKENGIDPHKDFKEVRYGGTHDAVVYAIRDGEADVGAVRTDTLERMAEEGKIDLKTFRIIGGREQSKDFPFAHSTRLYPEWPFAKVKHTSIELAEKVAVALIEMSPDSDAARAARCAGWTIPLNYQPVHECLKELRLGPYEDFGKVTLGDVIRKYWHLFFVIFALLLTMAGSLVVYRKLNRKIKASHEELKMELEERRRAEERIKHLNAVLHAIRRVNQLITREKDQHILIQGVCENLIETRGYHNAWIALFDESRTLVATAEAGLGEDFRLILEPLKHGELPGCALKALGQTGVVSIKDVSSACTECPLARRYGGRGAMSIRLEYKGRVYGLLTTSVPGKFASEEEEQALLQAVAGDIAFALRNIEVEEEAGKTEEYLQSVIDNISDLFCTMDLEGNILSINRAVTEQMGYEEKDLIGRPNVEFSVDKEYFKKAFKKVLEEGNLPNIEMQFKRRDGSIADILCSVTLVRDRNGQPFALAGFGKDVTKHKRAEEDRRRLATAIEQAAESIIITDAEGSIQYVNPGFERITGYLREEVIGQNPRILQSGKHDQAFYRELWGTIAAGKVWSGHFINRKKDGSLYEEEATISPVQDSAGRITNYVAVKRDVTEQVKLESQFRQAQKMEAIGTLAGGVAHDFNNLLTTIIGNADLALMDLRSDTTLYGHIEEIRKAGRRAASLTRQLLAFSRKQVIQPEVLNLNEILKETEKMLRRLIGEDIDLVTLPASGLWRVEVDPGQMEQVIMNLAVNARDAMPRGGKLTIETANLELDEAYFRYHGVENRAGPYVMLSVSDNGIGMDEEIQSHIFEPFFTTKEKERGTGLGLSTVYGIVKQNRGYVWVYSEPGKGTTFKVYFPRAEADIQSVKEDKSSEGSIKGTETILVVEDDDMLREMTVETLRKYGYEVVEARNGDEALRASNQHEGAIHLLLTDVVMPGMSGSALAERLRSERPDTRVLYMSGYTDNAVVHHGVLAEEVDFIQKPFSSEDLARKIRLILEDNKEESAGRQDPDKADR